MALSNVQIEISGRCNARCPYCFTGQKNRNHEVPGEFLSVENFVYALNILERKAIIDNSTVISLYNYGEPLLHPHFNKIIEELEKREYYYDISTNGSVVLSNEMISKMKHLKIIQFSICGTSQESYDRIHGFVQKTIFDNISGMIAEFRNNEINVECLLKLQMYQFNQEEYYGALKFSRENCMTVIPLHAIYANLQQQFGFIERAKKGEFNDQDKNLIVDYLPHLLQERDKTCIEHDGLVIDETLNVALCCMITKDVPEYYWQTLETISLEAIEKRHSCDYCQKCIGFGVSSSICKTPSYKKGLIEKIDNVLTENSYRKIVVVGDDPIANSFLQFCGKSYEIEQVKNINKTDSEQFFYILASRTWWKDKEFLLKCGKSEKKDFYVFNIYLR